MQATAAAVGAVVSHRTNLVSEAAAEDDNATSTTTTTTALAARLQYALQKVRDGTIIY